MIQIILLIIAICLALYGILLIKSFEYMSLTELKRQARNGNPDAAAVYPVRAYGVQLWILIWVFLGFLISGIILLLGSLLGSIGTIVISILLLVAIHVVVPRSRRPKTSLRMAAQVSPAIERVLRFLYPLLKRFERLMGRWIQPEPMFMIQSKDELIEILHHNAKVFDQVSRDELKIAESALIFGDKLIGDYMTPLNTIYFVKAEEELTPVVLGELHNSGHSRFPVYEGNNQNIIGTLFIKDVTGIKTAKPIKNVMRPSVYYINEQQSLDHALQAFIKTKHHMFVVVNEFEDVVGVLSVEDVLEQIIGQPILDEFDKFDDLREVAKQVAHQKHDDHEADHV